MRTTRLFIALGLPLMAACSHTPDGPVMLEQVSQCPITLHNGQTLTLRLPSNPTTGYRWLLQHPAANILRSLGPEVYTDPEEAGLVGSAGRSSWRFQSKAPGESHLILIYQQPWAPEVKPVKTFDCAVTVR